MVKHFFQLKDYHTLSASFIASFSILEAGVANLRQSCYRLSYHIHIIHVIIVFICFLFIIV